MDQWKLHARRLKRTFPAGVLRDLARKEGVKAEGTKEQLAERIASRRKEHFDLAWSKILA